MARKICADLCEARAEVYREMADHLLLSWTDCPLERREGDKISAELRKKENYWREKIIERS